MQAKHRVFSMGHMDGKKDWWGNESRLYKDDNAMMQAVIAFLTELGPSRIIAVHGVDSDHWMQWAFIVWYWQETAPG